MTCHEAVWLTARNYPLWAPSKLGIKIFNGPKIVKSIKNGSKWLARRPFSWRKKNFPPRSHLQSWGKFWMVQKPVHPIDEERIETTFLKASRVTVLYNPLKPPPVKFGYVPCNWRGRMSYRRIQSRRLIVGFWWNLTVWWLHPLGWRFFYYFIFLFDRLLKTARDETLGNAHSECPCDPMWTFHFFFLLFQVGY